MPSLEYIRIYIYIHFDLNCYIYIMLNTIPDNV